MAKIDELFRLMVEKNASDLHLTSGAPPYLRVHGHMESLQMKPLTNEQCQALVFEILTEKQRKDFLTNWELDCSYSVPNIARFRCNVFMQRKGVGGVFRQIPEEILSAEKLGLPEQILELANAPKGLILVTGPTGSGKSTTLAAMLDHINNTRHEHILTIEDPIEFVHQNKKCLVNQREVSSHTKSFSNALKAALREDPDIILVGEMRDLETIALAMTAAETGHLVFGTLHTNNAPATVDRIIDVFPTDQQSQIRVMLSESLKGVVAQRLFRKKSGKGRIACQEILVNNNAVANLIREGKTFQIPSIMQTNREDGMLPFATSVQVLIDNQMISEKDGMTFLGKQKKTQDAATTDGGSTNRPRPQTSLGSGGPPSGNTGITFTTPQKKSGFFSKKRGA